jgi:hypothetical protein
VALLLSVCLANLGSYSGVFGQRCIKATSHRIDIPGEPFPKIDILRQNITCKDTCVPVTEYVTFAVKMKKLMVVGCRKNKRVSGGIHMPLLPLSNFPVRKCIATQKPITQKLSVDLVEKNDTLQALMVDYVVDCA